MGDNTPDWLGKICKGIQKHGIVYWTLPTVESLAVLAPYHGAIVNQHNAHDRASLKPQTVRIRKSTGPGCSVGKAIAFTM